MKRFLMGVLTTLVIGVATGAALVYSGTFDPITLGHIDVAQRSAGLAAGSAEPGAAERVSCFG